MAAPTKAAHSAPRTKFIPPADDTRYKAVDRAMERFNHEKDALLEVLNIGQESFGYLPEELLHYISDQLGVPLAQVFGVATFYHMFSFEPLGEHNCVVCLGTACYVKGAESIIDALSEEFGIAQGQTTPDKKFSLTTARCLGSCGLAPVIVMDGQVIGKETPEGAVQVTRAALNGGDHS